jgi:hypothetical protein
MRSRTSADRAVGPGIEERHLHRELTVVAELVADPVREPTPSASDREAQNEGRARVDLDGIDQLGQREPSSPSQTTVRIAAATR